jgi:hypothetical protein
VGPRKTMGHLNWPPLMYRTFAALLKTWSSARKAKLKVMNSMTGRSPTMAAPTPSPAKPSSVMGVSTTRFSPNRSMSPFDTLYAPLYTPTSSPMRKTSGRAPSPRPGLR